MTASKITQIRAMIMEKLEWVLETCNSRNVIIVDRAGTSGFLEVDRPNVEELSQYHMEELSMKISWS
jgi:flagellar biosynthesis GTPase FlhF